MSESVTTASGLKYEDIEPGTGPVARRADKKRKSITRAG